MHRFFILTLAGLLAGSLVAPSDGGDNKKEGGGPPKVERGPEHKVLESLVGTYEAKVKFYLDPKKPTESKGLMTRTMILGGNYLQESYKGEFFGSSFSGLGIVAYDGHQKKYVTTWFDSMSTSVMLLHGTYDAQKRTLTMTGEDFDPASKKKMKARDVLKIISADEQFFEMFRQPEGVPEEFKVMEITYTRKKDAKK